MEIITAKKAGFCSGVKRAVEMAQSVAQKKKKLPLYSLGPLVHNPRVVQELGKSGIHPVNSIEGIPPGVLIIRSHGAPIEIIEEARNTGFEIVDATCPLVARIHDIVTQLDAEGYTIIIVGHRDHPEVRGIKSRIKGTCHIVENSGDLDNIGQPRKLGVVSQTTALASLFDEIAQSLVIMAFEVRIFNTICPATACRQEAAARLAPAVDLMIVVGGKNSSNTTRLVEICQKLNSKTYHVENPQEIKKEWLDKAETIGLTAGASTPPEDLDEINKQLRQF